MTTTTQAGIATPRLWGHRGLGGTAYENSLAGFEQALAQGAVGIELDVRLCRSGQLVVVHDTDLMRVAGRPERVAELDLAALGAIQLRGSGEAIPSLTDAIALVRGRDATLNIELKTDVPDLDAAVAELAAVIGRHSPAVREGLLVSSFGIHALAALHALGVPRLALLTDAPTALDALPEWVFAIHPHASLITTDAMAGWRSRALQVNTWTVNDGGTARQMAALGVDAIITDDVPTLHRALQAAD